MRTHFDRESASLKDQRSLAQPRHTDRCRAAFIAKMEQVNEDMRCLVRSRPGTAPTATPPNTPSHATATIASAEPPSEKYQALIGALVCLCSRLDSLEFLFDLSHLQEAEVASLKRDRDEPGSPMSIDVRLTLCSHAEV